VSFWYADLFHSLKKNLLDSTCFNPAPKLLATTNMLTISVVLPFPECHINIITH
jgi:hypothetical protein